MKQVFLQQGKARLYDVDAPACGDYELLVRVAYSCISSGTEYATMSASSKNIAQKFMSNVTGNAQKLMSSVKENGIQGTLALIAGSMCNVLPVGYSCSGKVIAVGSKIKKYKVGDMVACGGATQAYHAQVIAVPEHLTVLVKHESALHHASIATIGSIALQGVRRAQVQLGEQVCVIGLGLLGQLTTQLVKASGGFVYGVDVMPERLRMALAHGADAVYHATDESWRTSLAYATDHYGVDTTIITASSSTGELINHAMQITRRKGKVIIVGDVKLDFDREQCYHKEIDLLISTSYGPGRYDHTYEQLGQDYPYAYVRWTENRNMQLFVQLIEQKKINLDALMSVTCDLANVDLAYDYVQKKEQVCVVLRYEQEVSAEQSIKSSLPIRAIPYKASSHLQVGVIGVGGFCKVKLLPLLARYDHLRLHAFADPNTAQALSAARLYSVDQVYATYEKILRDPLINVVVIATPHALHTEQLSACLQAGKAVFVEKPAATTIEQYQQLLALLKDNDTSLLCVDFNRTYAPIMQVIKQAVSQRTAPLMVNYRMNVGYLPSDHWIQSAEHGGRIIGEACHIFDLFLWLTQARPVNISVTPLQHYLTSLAIADNVVATIRMDDGSVCTLTFVSHGSPQQSKEYMEVFWDGKSMVMDDFKSLKSYGMTMRDNRVSRIQDKGHEALLYAFLDQARTENFVPPISYERILMSTKLTLEINCLF